MSIRRRSLLAAVMLPVGSPAGPLGASTLDGLTDASAALKVLDTTEGGQRQALGVDQVDETSDVNKSVLTAQAQALAAKVGRAEADSAFARDMIVASGKTGNVGLSLRKTAVSATMPEVCGQFVIGSNVGGKIEQAFKIGVYGAAQGGPNSGYVLGGNFTGQGYAGAGGYVVTAVEGDVNNNGAAAGAPGSATAAYGFMSVAAGYAGSTSAYAATGGNQSWQFGYTCFDYGKPGATVAAFNDQSAAPNALQITGPKTALVNALGAQAGFGLLGGNNFPIVAQLDTANNIRSLLKLDASNVVQIGAPGVASIAANQSLNPAADNSLTLGTASLRWASISAADGVIHTSDPARKTAVRDLGTVVDPLAFIATLRPIASKWVETASAETETYIVEERVLRTRTEIRTIERPVEHDGRWFVQSVTEQVEVLDPDLVPMLDPTTGLQATVTLKGKPQILDESGNVVQAAVPAQVVPRTHAVPAYVIKPITRTRPKMRAGVRDHYSLDSDSLQAALTAAGVDAGVFVKDAATGEIGQRAHELVPVLIAALQAVTTRLAAVEAKLAAKA